MKKVKYEIHSIIVSNKGLLLFNFCLFCFICGGNKSRCINLNTNLFEFILVSIIDHYYILYCLFPTTLIMISKHLKTIDDTRKIRYRNFREVIKNEVSSFICWIVIYIFLHFVVSLLIGINSFEINWSFSTFLDVEYDEIVFLLKKYCEVFSSPIISSLFVLLYYVFGLSMLISLLSLSKNYFGEKVLLKLTIIIFVLTFIGFKTKISWRIPFLFFNNYIILHHGLFVAGKFSFVMNFLIGSSIIIYCLYIMQDRYIKNILVDKILLPNRLFLGSILTFILITIVDMIGIFFEKSFNVKYLLVSIFAGISVSYNSFISWSKISLIYLIPVFAIAISKNRSVMYFASPVYIRYRNMSVLKFNILCRYVKFVFKYFLIIVSVVAFFYVIDKLCMFNSYETHLIIDEMGMTNNFYENIFIYLIVFFINMLFNLMLFDLISERTSINISFILILLLFYIEYIFPNFSIIFSNIGIIQFVNMTSNYSGLLILNIAIKTFFVFFCFLFKLRRIYGNNKINECI